MSIRKEITDTLVVGAGQAGVAMSAHLTAYDVPHIVLEKDRIAEAWRTGRWDSLVTNGPAWYDCFPAMGFSEYHQDAFVAKEDVAAYFEAYAKKISAPIRTGVEVRSVVKNSGKPGFTIETSDGVIEAMRVVSATGPFHKPVIPSIAPPESSIHQIHSAKYFNPEQLPNGGILIIGAGCSGVQIADELQRSGREVYLSVGRHVRSPRTYRNRDISWWLGSLGLWDTSLCESGKEHHPLVVSGAGGGKTIDFRELAKQGINLVGRTKSFEKSVVSFHNDLNQNINFGDDFYLRLLDAADKYIESNGLILPEEKEAYRLLPDPECMINPVSSLDLIKAGVTSVIWATGYRTDYNWLKVNTFDASGRPLHQRGVSVEPGVYFLGLPWLSRRVSTFIWGVWYDAKYIADHIAMQRKFSLYLSESDSG